MMRVNIHSIKLGVDRCYVIQGEGTIMIDAGGPRQAARFRKALEVLTIDPHSIRLIVITHGHWDHIGSAKEIQAMTAQDRHAPSGDGLAGKVTDRAFSRR